MVSNLFGERTGLREKPEVNPRTSNAEGSEEADEHEGPVAGAEELGLGVEGDVGQRALGVVVWRGELGAGRVETTGGGGGLGNGTDNGAGEHLGRIKSAGRSSLELIVHFSHLGGVVGGGFEVQWLFGGGMVMMSELVLKWSEAIIESFGLRLPKFT